MSTTSKIKGWVGKDVNFERVLHKNGETTVSSGPFLDVTRPVSLIIHEGEHEEVLTRSEWEAKLQGETQLSVERIMEVHDEVYWDTACNNCDWKGLADDCEKVPDDPDNEDHCPKCGNVPMNRRIPMDDGHLEEARETFRSRLLAAQGEVPDKVNLDRIDQCLFACQEVLPYAKDGQSEVWQEQVGKLIEEVATLREIIGVDPRGVVLTGPFRER